MKILKLYEHVITEAAVTSCTANFGKELFGQELGGTEPNTRIEKSYVKMINDFTSQSHGQTLNPKLAQALGNLKGCMSKYSEVLTPESVSVYRGLTIPLSYFIENNINTTQPFSYNYAERSLIQSWTLNPDIAAIFGNNDDVNQLGEIMIEGGYNKSPEKAKKFLELARTKWNHLRVAVVLQHKSTNKDFLFKSKYFKELSNNSHEEEILRIDNSPINLIAKFNDHHDVFLTHDGLMALNIICRFR